MKKSKILFIIGLLFLITGCGKESLGEVTEYDTITYQTTNKKTNNVVIELEQEKKIIVELYPEVAPITVTNFKKLVQKDFYNDTIFHRVIKDFVIQGGDGTTLGRNTNTIKGEFASNGVSNSLKHERGVLSMARASSMDSASSQFFIVLENNQTTQALDGEYAAFGRVIAGMSVVDEIASVVTDRNDKPLKDIKIKNMEFVKVIENE